jgi:serine/threonine protein kinase
VNSDRWEEIQSSFDELVELDAAARARRLAKLALSDPELHRSLKALLEADGETGVRLAQIDALLPGSLHQSDPPGPLVSALADRYRIEREIGAGGMATVYLTRDLKHDRDVAVKVLRPQLAAVLGVNRFLNEIRISARLDHPHILTLIDSGAANGFLYYVMPFVRGESLRVKLKRDKQLGIDEALEITRQIISALDYAHRQGVVHRDIKPENILLHEGEAVLADFGIATAVQEAGGSRLTESGLSLGTPQYMSPEQATGDCVLDARSDVYSMAAVLYEMLAGEPPHTGVSKRAVIAKLLTERPTRLRVIRDTVPETVDAAVAKALAKLPADRYAKAGDFARALASPSARAPAKRLWARSRKLVPGAIVGTLVTAAAIAATVALSRKSAPRPQPDKVQLTLTGNAGIPSLSSDGTRLAFREQQCNSAGCKYQLVIQEIDGPNRLVLTSDLEWIWSTGWTDNDRFVVFAGSYGGSRRGLFAISSLRGEPRSIPYGWWHSVGDTAYLSAGVVAEDVALRAKAPGGSRQRKSVSSGGNSVGWIRRVSVHDGRTGDSVPVRDVGDVWYTLSLSPDRLLVISWKTRQSFPELRLIDRRGNVLDRATPRFGSLGGFISTLWTPSMRKLVVGAQRDLSGTIWDFYSLDITRSAIGRRVDTVLAGIETRNVQNLSLDGERLVYYAGPVESELSTIEVDLAATKPLAVTPHVWSRTTIVRGRLSPAGDRVLVARDTPRGLRHTSQFLVIGRNGGGESPIAGALSVENLLDFDWSPDGARILYLQRMEGPQLRLMESDTTGRSPREMARFDESAIASSGDPGGGRGGSFHPLADGAVSIIASDRLSLSIIRRSKTDVTLRDPQLITEIHYVAQSPDAKSLAVGGRSSTLDSIVVATVEMETGRFKRVAALPGEDLGAVTWLKDGGIIFVFREPDGSYALYRVFPGRPAQKVGALPYSRAEFSISSDGKHVAAFGYNDKTDIYMIRNFGKLLRR